MKAKYICLAAVLFLIKGISFAQETPTVMNMPVKYVESPDGDPPNANSESKPSSNIWIVFSDRDDNKVYSEPGDGNPIKTVNFLDKFYVTGESGDYLQVYKWAEGIKLDGTGKKVQLNPKKAEKVGWIKKDNLLLWTRCLLDKKTKFSAKALAMFNAENLDAHMRKNNTLKIFNQPEMVTENKNTVKMFNFLYVYKKVGKAVLIGEIYKSNVYSLDKDILGWVDEAFLQQWPDRMCLQPNTDADAVNARKKAGVKASMFAEKDDVLAWKEGTLKKINPSWDDDSYDEKWEGSRLRFPVFTKEGDMVYTGYSTPLFKEGTDVKILSEGGLASAVDKAQNMMNETNNVNIVFVIDAGFGMRSYSNAIINSLKQLISRRAEMYKDGAQQKVYRYGAVIYRSDEDKACPGGSLALNKISLTADASNVTQFLDNEFNNEGCSSNELNKDVNAALLEALNMIKDGNKSSLQSNCIFFLGGATGNANAEVETIPALIAQYDVNLSVFQVHSAQQTQFELFPLQFKDILDAAKTKKNQLTSSNFRSEIAWKPVLMNGDQNLFSLDFPKSSPIMGDINFPDKGDAIPANVIDDILDKTIDYYENQVEKNITTVRTLFTGEGDKNVDNANLNAAVKNYLNRIGKKMNDYDLARKFNGQNVQFFIPAWATASVDKLEKPVFKYVIYVNQDELDDMIRKFESLMTEESPTDMRNDMYDAYQSLITAYFGQDSHVDENMKNKMTMDDILSRITGLPSQSQLLSEIKINDIKDPGKVSDENIEEVATRIRRSYEALQNVSKDLDNSMRNVTHGGVYYWIPQDYLP